MLDTDYSAASTVAGVSTCAWSPDHVFMLCDQALMVDSKPERDLSVFVYDSANASFQFLPVSKRRAAIHDGPVISADGNHWE